MGVKIEKLSMPQRMVLGEAPHWDPRANALYFADILEGKVFKYDPTSGEFSVANIGPENVSFVIPVAGKSDKFVFARNCDLKILTWDGKTGGKTTIEHLVQLEDETVTKNKINDGKCDPRGRVFAGTTRPYDGQTETPEKGTGFLYNYTAGGKVNQLDSNIALSNGMAWSLDSKKMYYNDSLRFCVYSYDYNIQDGSLCNRHEIFNFKKSNVPGIPDGMTIDNTGKLWIACFEGAKVIRICPDTGKLLYQLDFPAFQTTSVAFGGPNLDILYVTSANMFQTEESKQKYPDYGSLFKVTGLHAKGTPMISFKM